MPVLKIKKKNKELGYTKELKVWSKDKIDSSVVLGVAGETSKQWMWVGITLEQSDVKRVIKFLQKQVGKEKRKRKV